jgi:hypothetical protein
MSRHIERNESDIKGVKDEGEHAPPLRRSVLPDFILIHAWTNKAHEASSLTGYVG